MFCSVPGLEGRACVVSGQMAQESISSCFDFALAGDGSWAGAAGQELASAAARTGQSYSAGDE